MRRLVPLGLSDEPPPPDGVAPYAGSSTPGPQGRADEASFPSDADTNAGFAEHAVDGSADAPFTVGSDMFRLRHVDAERALRSSEEPVAPDQAARIIERALLKPPRNAALLRALETAASQLVGLHDNGAFILFWLRPQIEKSARSAAPTTPAPPRPPRPREVPDLPIVEEPVMGDAQAAVLKAAAAAGVPFCEECARAAARRGASPA